MHGGCWKNNVCGEKNESQSWLIIDLLHDFVGLKRSFGNWIWSNT